MKMKSFIFNKDYVWCHVGLLFLLTIHCIKASKQSGCSAVVKAYSSKGFSPVDVPQNQISGKLMQ